MNPSMIESYVSEPAPKCPADLISDDDLPWDEVIAEMNSKEGKYVFNPADYSSDEAMMAAVEALLLKWAGEGEDEE